MVKRWIVGRFTAGRRDRTQYNLFRHWLIGELVPVCAHCSGTDALLPQWNSAGFIFSKICTALQGEKLQDVAHLIGVHYEGVSIILRLLGAKACYRERREGEIFTSTLFDVFVYICTYARIEPCCEYLCGGSMPIDDDSDPTDPPAARSIDFLRNGNLIGRSSSTMVFVDG